MNQQGCSDSETRVATERTRCLARLDYDRRLASELRGDFSEIDAHIRDGHRKLLAAAIIVLACAVAAWLLP